MKINIACGGVYVNDWENFDYSTHSKNVKKANCLHKIPISNNVAEAVYSSHFLEHIPKSKASVFLQECFRITASKGKIRLVLPDLEELCKSYLVYRENEQHSQADFLMIEMIDQCVRQASGGELGKYYQSKFNNNDTKSLQFIKQRTGHVIEKKIENKKSLLKRVLNNPRAVLSILERMYCHTVIRILPRAFKEQNISLTSVGEKHMWIYDFYTVQQVLLQIGFVDVKRMTANSSGIDNFPFYPLDIDNDGLPRKGIESMYIEAMKP